MAAVVLVEEVRVANGRESARSPPTLGRSELGALSLMCGGGERARNPERERQLDMVYPSHMQTS